MRRPAEPEEGLALGPWARGLRAVVLDTDGVLTDTARTHAAAWKAAFDGWLRAHPPADPAARRPFDADADYRAHVDGRSRLDGAAGFLAARGSRPPLGTPDDPPQAETVWAVAAAKDRLFTERLRAGAVAGYPDAVLLLRALRAAGIRCAAASASRHAAQSLAVAGLLDLVPVVLDGTEAARLGLPGKPDPALFIEAARRLGVAPEQAAVVEDAAAGVRAARRGGFALVVGVDRTADGTAAARLRGQGADLVVADLARLLGPAAPARAGRESDGRATA